MPAIERESVIGLVGTYASFAIRAARWRIARPLILAVLVSVCEGASVALLLPALRLAGLASGEPQGAPVADADAVSRFVAHLGLHPGFANLLAGFLVLSALRALLGQLQSVALFDVEQRLSLAMRRRLYRAIVSADWIAVSRTPSAQFAYALTDQSGRFGAGAYTLLVLCADVVVGAAYVVLALALSWRLTLLVLAAGAALSLALSGAVRALHESGQEVIEASDVFYATTIDHVQNVRATKTHSVQDLDLALFSRAARRVARAYMEVARRQAAAGAWFELGSVAALGAGLFASVELLKLPPATILILLLIFSRLMPRLLSCHNLYRAFASTLPAFEALKGALEGLEAVAEPPEQDAAALPLRRELRLTNVAFSYRADAAPALEQVSLVVPAGWIVALVGPSGSGKSTIADLAMGLLFPAAGVVSLDGAPLMRRKTRAFRRAIGYVGQETPLFNQSIRDNLLWGRPSASEADIMAALRLAAADEFVLALRDGLETIVGERGLSLSQGERQRLALARALLRRPSLLVLDEATSNLDTENEARIFDALRRVRPPMTILLISHRRTAVRQADLIYLIEGGRVVEAGTRAELLDRRRGKLGAWLRDAPPQPAQDPGASGDGPSA